MDSIKDLGSAQKYILAWVKTAFSPGLHSLRATYRGEYGTVKVIVTEVVYVHEHACLLYWSGSLSGTTLTKSEVLPRSSETLELPTRFRVALHTYLGTLARFVVSSYSLLHHALLHTGVAQHELCHPGYSSFHFKGALRFDFHQVWPLDLPMSLSCIYPRLSSPSHPVDECVSNPKVH